MNPDRNPSTSSINIIITGTLDYDTALALQTRERERLIQKKSGGAVIFLEHDPGVITLGRRASRGNILLAEDELEKKGYQIRFASRGGDVTVHEKGQMVAYFILPVQSKKAGFFIDSLMGMVTDSIIGHWGLKVWFDRSRPGIWIDDRKLASVGFDLTGQASMHGLALNVCNSLDGFRYINPCGLSSVSMTTLERELGRKIDVAEAIRLLSDDFRRNFET
ncbi:MAG TPA: lipoyl(octanoyl) transferase LipB [Spirochaetota bacterium]|nr:lipoyl(octanoyl) transferase LipB [Spirochaetota bacterium]HRZ25585.1 lipoyl(octanoyl) transferase LipB [Spirochaetota bacterium]HSA15791.1 lipoyl(octanoyl) transferase LipB [Spirochaetota bacterium]